MDQKVNVKALQDELSESMNVHRWRKIEAVDQENYERILQIQALQRRLITKTEEVLRIISDFLYYLTRQIQKIS